MDKKVLILSASPRKGGNSETLCAEFTRGVRQYEMTPALVRRGFACHTLDANQM